MSDVCPTSLVGENGMNRFLDALRLAFATCGSYVRIVSTCSGSSSSDIVKGKLRSCVVSSVFLNPVNSVAVSEFNESVIVEGVLAIPFSHELIKCLIHTRPCTG